MKTLFISISILLLTISCKAQSVISKREVTVGTSKYINNGKVLKTGEIVVQNSNNNLWGTPIINGDGTKSNYPPDIIFNKKEKNALKQKIAALFTSQRLRELSDEKNFTLYFFLNDDGIPLEIYFVLNYNSKLSASEIKKMEDYLKKNITIPLSSDRFKGINHYVVNITIPFNELQKSKN